MNGTLDGLKKALKEMDNAIDILLGVAEDLDGTPLGDVVDSVRADLEELYFHLNRTYKELEEKEDEEKSF